MKTLNFFIAALISAVVALACNSGDRRATDDSVDQARNVNDTAATTNRDDTDFAVKAADAGLAEIELGKLALEKSNDPRVKEFAQKIVEDHSKVVEELMTVASQKNIVLPAVPSDDHVEKVQDLKEAPDADFDSEYIAQIAADHSRVVSWFEDAAEDAEDPDIKSFATKNLSKLKQHHELAKELRDSLGGNGMERIVP